jgi:hypothetical protein
VADKVSSKFQKKPVMLFRVLDEETRQEMEVASRHFMVTTSRCDHKILSGSLVVGRYSVLPHYREVEFDLSFRNSSLVHTWRQHRFIADIEQWYSALKFNNNMLEDDNRIPETWFRVEDVPLNQPGAFILKGRTNSRKDLWDTHCFAKDRADVSRVHNYLLDDREIASQGIVVRQYVPLANFSHLGVTSIRGRPVTEEFRLFFFDGQYVAGGFYWSDSVDEIADVTNTFATDPGSFADPPAAAIEFGQLIADQIREDAPFVCIDVARAATGDWTLIELNDGQQAGLSCIHPEHFYARLAELVRKKVQPPMLICPYCKHEHTDDGKILRCRRCDVCLREPQVVRMKEAAL